MLLQINRKEEMSARHLLRLNKELGDIKGVLKIEVTPNFETQNYLVIFKVIRQNKVLLFSCFIEFEMVDDNTLKGSQYFKKVHSSINTKIGALV